MQVSVIIPVFNAAAYVETAIRSCLAQKQVKEILLIDDGSSDGSFEICRQLANSHEAISFVTHTNRINRGVSATRNLGLELATSDYISFLDADDYFLPARFRLTEKLFNDYPETDAAYECVGTQFETEEDQRQWGHRPLLTTMDGSCAPNEFFYRQRPIGEHGHICVGGWTFKRSILSVIGDFPQGLAYGEDTAFFLKVSIAATCRSGKLLKPVAMRRVHGSSATRVHRNQTIQVEDRTLMWKSVILWAYEKNYCKQARTMMNRMAQQILWPRPSDEIKSVSKARIIFKHFPGASMNLYFWKGVFEVAKNITKIRLGNIRRRL